MSMDDEEPKKTRLEKTFEILEKHRHDTPSYDAYYLEGCDGCKWLPDREYDDQGQDSTWRQFHIHVAKEIERMLREFDSTELMEAVKTGLRGSKVDDDAPVALIKETDILHVSHMVTTEVEKLLRG